jgi:phospholipase C
VVTRSGRAHKRIRVVAAAAAGGLGLFGLAAAGSAGAQPSVPAHSAVTSIRYGAQTAVTAHRKQTSPIKHIVVLYLENHSFDNLLGFWCDQNPSRCPDGGMPSSVKLSNGVMITPRNEPDKVPDISHTVASQQAAIDGGKMDGWQNVMGCQATNNYICVGGYQPSQVPNMVTLANDFAISDHTFSMANSPSWGGHLYSVMGSLDGFTGDNPVKAKGVTAGPGWGCNSDKVTPWHTPTGPLENVPSCVPDFNIGLPNGGAFRPTPVSNAPTIMDLLSQAGLSWKIYGQPSPVSGGGVANGYIWDICPSIAECLDTSQFSNNVPSASFVNTAKAGNLPAFAVVTPGGKDAAFSEHNGFSMTAGDDWLGRVASAVMNGPEWNSTALFITWDDCGCFYDQVTPGTNPDGTPQGPRSPLIIVSPFARPGFTDTTATSFAGILHFAESNFGLQSLGPNDASAYAFANAFNFGQKPLKPARMIYRKWPKDAYHVNMAEARQDT